MNLCSWWRAALREAAVGPARWGRAAGAPRGSSSSSTAPTAAPWTAPVRAARGDNGSADNGSALCRAAGCSGRAEGEAGAAKPFQLGVLCEIGSWCPLGFTFVGENGYVEDKTDRGCWGLFPGCDRLTYFQELLVFFPSPKKHHPTKVC